MADTDDAAQVLASQTPPPQMNELGDSMTPPPPSVPTNELGDPLASIAPQSAPQTTPAHQDPEMVAGAAHQSELAKIMHAVGGLLGGDKTYRATPQSDGSIKITNDDSTTGEMWRRIAAEALGGAAKGLAVGQGPGGPARATAAGINEGLNFQQNQREAANKDAEAQQKILLNNANMAALNARNVRDAFNNKHLDRDDLQVQENYALDLHDKLTKQGFQPFLMNAKDVKTIAKYVQGDPTVMGYHTGQEGGAVFTQADGKGGVNLYKLSPQAANQLTSDPTPVELWEQDPKDATNIIKTPQNIPAGTTNLELAKQLMAISDKHNAVAKAAGEARDAKIKANATAGELELKKGQQDSIIARNKAAANESNARAQQIRTQGQTEAGTPEQNAQMMVDGLAAPSQFSKRAKEYNQLLPLANAYSMQKYGVPFDAEMSEGRYRARQAVIKDFADGKEADQIQSFNQFLGHSQDFTDSIAGLRNTNSPLLNTPLNKLRKMTGRPEVASILPKIEAVRTEYQNFLNNNHALHGQDIEEGKKMLDENASPAQMEAAAKSFAQTALIRTGTVNDRYKRTMKTNVPDLLNDESLKTLSNYGLGDMTQRVLTTTAHPASGGTIDVPAGGKVYHFNTKEEADAFKQKAGIK